MVKFIKIQVAKKSWTELYLKVPDGLDSSTILHTPSLIADAVDETIDNMDWDDYDWLSDLEIGNVNTVDEEELKGYRVFDVEKREGYVA